MLPDVSVTDVPDCTDLLIPTTDNAELRALLVQVRPAIATHLEHAKNLRRSLVAGS